MKIFLKFFFIVSFLSITHHLAAQVLAPNRDNEDVTFSDLNEKFIRNMKVLVTLINDPETQKSMDAVIGQAGALGRFYNSKNTDSKREKMLKRSEDMTSKESLSKNDFIKMQKMRNDLREMDPDNTFGKGSEQIMKTIEALQKNLNQSYTPNNQDKDVIRITRQHLSFYTSALSKLR